MQCDTVLLGLWKMFGQLCVRMLHTFYLCKLRIKILLYHKGLHFAYILCVK
jgi:hypothetical protein